MISLSAVKKFELSNKKHAVNVNDCNTLFQRWPFLKSAFGDLRYISLLHVYNPYVFHK